MTPRGAVVGFSLNPELTLRYQRVDGKNPVHSRQEALSGTSLDVLLWLKEFGVPVELIAGIGRDDAGADSAVRRYFSSSLIKAHLLPIRECTSLAVVAIDERTGQSQHFSHRASYLGGVTDQAIYWVKQIVRAAKPAFRIATGVLPEDVFLVQNLFAERQPEKTTCLLNPRAVLLQKSHRQVLTDLLGQTDVVILNHEELSNFAGERLDGPESLRTTVGAFHDLGVKVVFVTCAERGAYLFVQGSSVVHQGTTIVGDIVDETGAGDAFLAGVVIARFWGWSYPEALPLAALLAGFALTGVGGAAVQPYAKILEEWKRRYPNARELRRD